MVARRQQERAAPEFPVDDRLCLALYTASRAMTSRYRPLLAGLGLTYPQYLVMALLWERGPQPVGTIGHVLALDSSTLSPLLKRLEAVGLVRRDRDPADERRVVVRTTSRGSELEREAVDVPRQICDAAGLPMGQQDALVHTLRDLTAELEGGRPA